MSWWSKKSEPTKPPSAGIIPFRRPDRPEVLERLRNNAERRMRPVETPRQVERFRVADSDASFIPVDFQSVDEVLGKVHADIRHGLIDPSAVIIATYDKMRAKVMWYQFGREDDEADEALMAWLDDQLGRGE